MALSRGVAGGQLPVMGQSCRRDDGVCGADRPAQAFAMAHQGSEPLRCRTVERQHRLLEHVAQKHVPALLQLLPALRVGQSHDALQNLGFVHGGDGHLLRLEPIRPGQNGIGWLLSHQLRQHICVENDHGSRLGAFGVSLRDGNSNSAPPSWAKWL